MMRNSIRIGRLLSHAQIALFVGVAVFAIARDYSRYRFFILNARSVLAVLTIATSLLALTLRVSIDHLYDARREKMKTAVVAVVGSALGLAPLIGLALMYRGELTWRKPEGIVLALCAVGIVMCDCLRVQDNRNSRYYAPGMGHKLSSLEQGAYIALGASLLLAGLAAGCATGAKIALHGNYASALIWGSACLIATTIGLRMTLAGARADILHSGLLEEITPIGSSKPTVIAPQF